MTIRNIILTAAAVSVLALPSVAAATPEGELQQLESQLQSFVKTGIDSATTENVAAAFSVKISSSGISCTESYCEKDFTLWREKPPLRGDLKYEVYLIQRTTSMTKATYTPNAPFDGKTILFELRISSPGLCFSPESWNAQLTQAGWEPLLPFTNVRKVPVGEKDHTSPYYFITDEIVDVPISGFATRRGDIYLELVTKGENFRASSVTDDDLEVIAASGACLRTVVVDSHDARENYEAIQKPAAPPAQ